jgi:hypothetical protein
VRRHERIESMEHPGETRAVAGVHANEIARLALDGAVVEDHRLDERVAACELPHRGIELPLLDLRVTDDAPHHVDREQADLLLARIVDVREAVDGDSQLAELLVDAVVLGAHRAHRLREIDGCSETAGQRPRRG